MHSAWSSVKYKCTIGTYTSVVDVERSENSSTRDEEMKKLGPGFKGGSAGGLKLVGCQRRYPRVKIG